MLTRRAALALLLSATAAGADAPARVMRPRYRGEWPPPPPPPPSIASLRAEANITGQVGIALADPATGRLIEGLHATTPLPPASVAKVVTALYALDALGPDYRFTTRLLATGPVTDGTLNGDLILAGGGDPVLVTDTLADLAASLRATGLRRVTGRFLVWGAALPRQFQIDPGQLPHLGYNPAISGLNLNFNRVHFEWTGGAPNWQIAMDARSDLYRPPVTMATMRIADRDLPVYDYTDDAGIDRWSVARTALTEPGSRWLPVRQPEIYTGQVFRSFAQAQGIDLPEPTVTATATGAELVRHDSAALADLIRDMLDFSTNITAEVLGLTASLARGLAPVTLADSAAAMTDWLARAHGVTGHFVNHSGLSDDSLIAPAQMVRLLSAPGVADRLLPLLKTIRMTDADLEDLPDPPGDIRAKTGTLNFVTTLAGYVTPTGRPPRAFAIFAADPAARAAAESAQDEQPDGTAGWNRRARRLQQVLLQRWAVLDG